MAALFTFYLSSAAEQPQSRIEAEYNEFDLQIHGARSGRRVNAAMLGAPLRHTTAASARWLRPAVAALHKRSPCLSLVEIAHPLLVSLDICADGLKPVKLGSELVDVRIGERRRRTAANARSAFLC
jgi:hypothetical protein